MSRLIAESPAFSMPANVVDPSFPITAIPRDYGDYGDHPRFAFPMTAMSAVTAMSAISGDS